MAQVLADAKNFVDKVVNICRNICISSIQRFYTLFRSYQKVTVN